jgi:hypothetical protein
MRVLALGLLLALFLTFWDSCLLLPLKLGVVALHELGHALMTWATGGAVVDFGLGLDQSGHVLSQGGNRFLILNAGYLGSLLFGVLLLLLFRRPEALRSGRLQLLGWGGRAFGAFSVLYALVDIRDDVILGAGRSDAAMLAELTGVPAILWGLGWLAAGVAVLWKMRRWLI